MPRFSIIIPTFNRGSVIPRAIQSVFDQNSDDWELIIVDDGSTDDTLQVISPFVKELNFSYFFQENAGVSQARNFGAEKAVGEWLIFLDSDDELEIDSLFQFSNRLESNSFTQVVQGSYLFVEGKSTIIRNVKLGEVGFVSGSFVIKKELFITIGGYDPKLKFGENTELKFRLDKSNIKIEQFDFVAFKYHSATNEGSKNLVNMRDSITYILAKHEDYLSPHVKHLYFQNIGVIEMRFQNFDLARTYLFKSWKLKPKKISTLVRLALSFFPILSKKIYTTES